MSASERDRKDGERRRQGDIEFIKQTGIEGKCMWVDLFE